MLLCVHYGVFSSRADRIISKIGVTPLTEEERQYLRENLSATEKRGLRHEMYRELPHVQPNEDRQDLGYGLRVRMIEEDSRDMVVSNGEQEIVLVLNEYRRLAEYYKEAIQAGWKGVPTEIGELRAHVSDRDLMIREGVSEIRMPYEAYVRLFLYLVHVERTRA